MLEHEPSWPSVIIALNLENIELIDELLILDEALPADDTKIQAVLAELECNNLVALSR